ncbi:hypothetical protein [uncultured Campylobacter sp.]|uniref:hypothetical protein n=1 Tax=uncultured Campylobacter sp. TaxID=218934 RepID=UPI00262DE8DA|nr:hypothetical protein [uncultured Campylobacter sp.]
MGWVGCTSGTCTAGFMLVVLLCVAYVRFAWMQCGYTEPGTAIEILEFEARGTLNLIARKRRERVKFMSISYKIS